MTRRIERKCWAESLCVEPSGQKCCAEGSTPFPNLGFFYGKRLFFIIEEATQTSILCRETLAPEAAPPMQILARSNFERSIRSLGPIPSNLQVIYHQDHHLIQVVNALRSEQVLPSNMSICHHM